MYFQINERSSPGLSDQRQMALLGGRGLDKMTPHFHYFMIQLSLTFLTANSNCFLGVNPFS